MFQSFCHIRSLLIPPSLSFSLSLPLTLIDCLPEFIYRLPSNFLHDYCLLLLLLLLLLMFGSGFQSPYIRPWTLSESPLFLLLVCLPACLLVLGIPLRPLWKLNPFFYFSKYYTSSSGPPDHQKPIHLFLSGPPWWLWRFISSSSSSPPLSCRAMPSTRTTPKNTEDKR